MNFSNNQDGACTWTKPDNWIAYVEHFRNKFTHSNVVYPWGQNGYIAAQYHNYLYSLGDFSFCSALDIYIDTIKDWYKYSVHNYTGGISFGVFPRNI